MEIFKTVIIILFTSGITYFIAINVKFAKDKKSAIRQAINFMVVALGILLHIFVAYLLIVELLSEASLTRLAIFRITIYSLALFNVYIIWIIFKFNSKLLIIYKLLISPDSISKGFLDLVKDHCGISQKECKIIKKQFNIINKSKKENDT